MLIKIVWKLDLLITIWSKSYLLQQFVFAINWLLPPFGNPFVGVILNSLCIGISYLGLILIIRPSDDIEQLLKILKPDLLQ